VLIPTLHPDTGPTGHWARKDEVMAQIFVFAAFAVALCWPRTELVTPVVSLPILQAAVLFGDDDGDGTAPPPLCHLVPAPSVLNCANSTPKCITDITPNWQCKLKVTGGCRCE
jgi:hypothetical protein